MGIKFFYIVPQLDLFTFIGVSFWMFAIVLSIFLLSVIFFLPRVLLTLRLRKRRVFFFINPYRLVTLFARSNEFYLLVDLRRARNMKRRLFRFFNKVFIRFYFFFFSFFYHYKEAFRFIFLTLRSVQFKALALLPKDVARYLEKLSLKLMPFSRLKNLKLKDFYSVEELEEFLLCFYISSLSFALLPSSFYSSSSFSLAVPFKLTRSGIQRSRKLRSRVRRRVKKKKKRKK